MNQRWVSVLLLTLLMLGISGSIGIDRAAAQTPPNAEAIQLTVQPAYGGMYRAGSWLPVRVNVANAGADVSATIAVQAGATFETSVDLPRGANKSVVVYALPTGGFRPSLAVRVLVGDQPLAQTETPLTQIGTTTQVIGLLTEQTPTLPLPQSDQLAQRFEIVPLQGSDIPERREGLALFDALILDGAPLTTLNPTQQQAIADWVRTGGQLVIGGTKLDSTISSVPEALRIATPDAPTQGPISLLPELASAPPSMSLIAAPAAQSIASVGPTSVGVQHDLGAGRVTMLGFSLAAPELAQLAPTTSFWSSVLRPRSSDPSTAAGSQEAQFGFALRQLPVLAMPPMGILIGLLAAYLLVVGPGLYVVLRRLDRQAWGWVAIPVITLLFSLGTYGYGLRLRGDDLILNQISVIEPAAGRARVRTYAGIFSPRSEMYQISSTSDALFKPMADPEMGAMPATGIGGKFVQGSSGVHDLHVDQWSMSMFAADQMLDAVPLEASLAMADGALRGSVRNTGTVRLRDVAIFQNTRVAQIGDLEPGQSHDVQLELNQNVPVEWGGSLPFALLRHKWDFNQSRQPPADILMQQYILEALYNSSADRPMQPIAIGWLDQTPIPLNLDRGRVRQQQLALVSTPVAVEYPRAQPITLPRGWLKPTFQTQAVSGGPCYSQFGNGWYLDNGELISTLQLPLSAQPLQIDQATFHLQTEGPRPELQLALFDWNANQWIDQPAVDTSLELEQPARFFSATGQFKARLAVSASMQGAGCMSTDLSLQGTRP